MDEYIAAIKLFGFNFAPRGWMLCQGQIMSIAQNTALFSLLGTNFGGNGQTTFGLPDLRGRVAVGMGQGPGLSNIDLGEVAGTENVTILTTQMPVHNHAATAASTSNSTSASTSTLYAEAQPGSSQNPLGRLLAGGTNFYAPEDPAQNRAMSSESVVTTTTTTTTTTTDVTVGAAGGGQPLSIVQPFLGLNYSICTEGIFPSRN